MSPPVRANMHRRLRAARAAATWIVTAGGMLGVPLALMAKQSAIAVAFYACAHVCLPRISRVKPDAPATLAWGACAASVCASTSGFSTCALQVAPALAAHAHARAVSAFKSELVTVVKAGRAAAVDCARSFAQRIRSGGASAVKTALDEVANESFFLIDEHVGKFKLTETDYRSAFRARRTAAGVLSVGVFCTFALAATRAPIAHVLGMTVVACVAATSVAFSGAEQSVESTKSQSSEGHDAIDARDEEVGERAAAAVRAGARRESYVVHALVACACLGAFWDADALGSVAATTVHFAGAYAFTSNHGGIADAVPVFLGVLVFVLTVQAK